MGAISLELDGRSKTLLQEVSVLSGQNLRDISKKYGLSGGQIDYSFKKINDWLKNNGIPPIIKDSNNKFISGPQHKKLFLKAETERNSYFIFSSEERAVLLCYMLLTKLESLSLTHLTLELGMSKNTVLADLKQAKKIAESYNLKIIYSRMDGYDIHGSEWNNRLLLLSLIEEIQKIINGQHLLEDYGHYKKEEIDKMIALIQLCETELHIRLTDQKYGVLPYIFSGFLRRIEQGKTLDSLCIDFSHEKVYKVIYKFFIDEGKRLSKQELSFLALQILTSNLSFSTKYQKTIDPKVMEGLKKMVQKFERISCTIFQDREELLQKLWSHLKPAYYRIKFGIGL